MFEFSPAGGCGGLFVSETFTVLAERDNESHSIDAQSLAEVRNF
jgi:hypothetical protein